jgi:hypothetical protein
LFGHADCADARLPNRAEPAVAAPVIMSVLRLIRCAILESPVLLVMCCWLSFGQVRLRTHSRRDWRKDFGSSRQPVNFALRRDDEAGMVKPRDDGGL